MRVVLLGARAGGGRRSGDAGVGEAARASAAGAGTTAAVGCGRLGGRVGRRLRPAASAAEPLLEAGHELAEQLVGDVLHHAAAELRGLAGDRQVGEHLDVGAAGPAGAMVER